MKRIPVATSWNPEWYYAVSENLAMHVAQRICSKRKKITFDRFHYSLINSFGICTQECAAFLWNRIFPDRARKYTTQLEDE